MNQTISCYKLILVAVSLFAFSIANAESGEDKAVVKARKDYADAVRSKDIGRINAMKIELAVQLAKSKEGKEKQTADIGNSGRKN